MLKPLLAVLITVIYFSFVSNVMAQDDEFANQIKALPSANYKTLPNILTAISQLDDPRSATLLKRMLEGDVFFDPRSQQVMYILKVDGEREWTDVLTETSLDEPKGVRLRKVRINNSVRSHIRQLQARLNLSHKEVSVRLRAAKEILSDVDEVAPDVIERRLSEESNAELVGILEAISAMQNLKVADKQTRLAALDKLRGNLQPDVRVALLNLQQQEDLATEVKDSLNSTLAGIETQRKWYGWAENVFFGVSMGSVLLLAAIGLAITFGVMGVINMAHGEMIMLGAYTTYVIQQAFPQYIEYSLAMAVPAAFLVSGLAGVIIERSVIQFLKGRPLETLLATFGISLILQQLVRTVFSPLNRQVVTPEWMSGSLQLNPVFSVTFNRLYIIIFSLTVFFALLIFLKRSSLGLHVRAVAQNRDMARALSVKSNWVDAATFGLGSGIAGVAGVVLSQLTNVGPNLGQAYIIDSFLVVVFGGVANLWGTLVSAMTLGILNKFLEPVTGPVMASIIVLVGLVFFIQKRPMGLFPQKGRTE